MMEAGHWFVMLAGHNRRGELLILWHNTDGDHNFGFYLWRYVNGQPKGVLGALGCVTRFHQAYRVFQRETNGADGVTRPTLQEAA